MGTRELQDHLLSLKQLIINEEKLLGRNRFLAFVMPDHDENGPFDLNYHDYKNIALLEKNELEKQYQEICDREREIDIKFQQHLKYSRSRRKKKKKRYHHHHQCSPQPPPPAHLTIEESEHKDGLEMMIKVKQKNWERPDCTHTARHMIIHMHKTQQQLPTIEKIIVSQHLKNSKSTVSVHFLTHDNSPFKASLCIGFIYYCWGETELDNIISEAYLNRIKFV